MTSKKHLIYLYLFLSLSILGSVDIMTNNSITAAISVVTQLMLSFVIIWIPLAIYEYFAFQKSSRKEKANFLKKMFLNFILIPI